MLIVTAAAGKAEGTAIRDAMRSVSQGDGEPVDNAVDGLRILSEGGQINYSGASGPCDFNEIGDISSATFRFDQVNDGEFELTIDDRTQRLGPGMVAFIPPNAVHSGRAVTRCRIIDVFHPVRDDYR